MPTANSQPTLPEKVVDLCGWTSAALEKASEVVDHQEKQAAALSELAPQVARALVEGGRIYASQEKEAAEQLRDPARALEILAKVAVHRSDEELSRLGQPVDENGHHKAASSQPRYNSLTNPNVGARTSMVKQSDINLFRKLGLTPPAS